MVANPLGTLWPEVDAPLVMGVATEASRQPRGRRPVVPIARE
jgi:hypothetical protein